MARKRRSTISPSEDDLDVSSDKLLEKLIKTPAPTPSLHLTPPLFNLKTFEDRRTWHPEGNQRPPQATQRVHRALQVAPATNPAQKHKLSPRLAFAAPKHVVLCVRRKTRKEVLFAKKLTRRGSSSKKHRNQWSSISCSGKS